MEAGGAGQLLWEEAEDRGEGGSIGEAWEDGGWAGGLDDMVFCRESSPTGT